MSASLFLADPSNLRAPIKDVPPVILHDDGYYWFLYWYFESANLERHKGEMIDLYGGAVIEGYQLHRLQTELLEALQDVERKSDSWLVLTGWAGTNKSVESECWRTVEKSELIRIIQSLLALTRASSSTRKLVCDGD